jgi:predicted transposase/invertase (TIGR01784 family)
MAEPWDDSLKTFINENPQDFVSWLLEDAQFKKKLQTEFKTRTIRADGLLEAAQHGRDMLLQIEFQSTNDPTIGERLLEYSFEAKRTHKLPVHSCVIYLRDVGEVQQSPLRWTLPDDRQVLRFDYQIIELAKIPTDELRQKDLKGLLPLLILTQGGAKREVVEEVINRLVAAKQQELLPVTKLLSSLAFESEDDQEWLTRRFHQMQDILRETRAYQEIIQEGKLEALHDALLKIVRERFPEMIEVMQKQIGGVVNPTTLEDLLVNISLAQNLQEALRALIALDKGEKKN